MFKLISKRTLLLLGLDTVAIVAAFSFAFFLREGSFYDLDDRRYVLRTLYHWMLLTGIFYTFDLYYPFKYFKKPDTVIEVTIAVFIGVTLIAASSYADRSLMIPRLIFFYAAVILVMLICFVRYGYDWIFASHFLDQRALIVGAGKLSAQVIEVIKKTPHSGIELVGVIQESKTPARKSVGGVPVLGEYQELMNCLEWYQARLVILALEDESHLLDTELLSRVFQQNMMVTSAAHLYEKITGEVPCDLLGGNYLLGLASQMRVKPYLKMKRLGDLFLAVALIVLFSPVVCTAALLLKTEKNEGVFFVQKRIGKGGRIFRLYKLRTMRDDRQGKPVMTRIGKWLRKFRIDEMPQLWNVLKGEMSLVGPRPEIPYFANRCRKRIPYYDLIYSVNPGLTGWAQVNFRYTTSLKDYDHKFRYNLYYLKHMSIILDLLILVKTIRIILLGKGQ